MKPDVTSHRNERAKLVKRLVRDPAERRREATCIVEGLRGVAEALAAGPVLRFAFVSPRLLELPGGPALLARLEAVLPAEDLLRATDEVLGSISDTRAPQGVMLALARPATDAWPEGAPLLAAWEVQDPGNAGAIVRTAEASGCRGAILARGPGGSAADPFSPRAIRAAAGSAFRLPLHEWSGAPSELAERLDRAGTPRAACVARGGRAPEDCRLADVGAILVGSETRGLPEELVRGAVAVTIPLAPRVESLNAAAAAAVVAFEAARQRRIAG